MRVLLGLALLVIVLATVAQLVKSQVGSLSVLGGLPASSPAAPSAPVASPAAPVGPGLRTTPMTEDVKRILDAGAASRASEPER